MGRGIPQITNYKGTDWVYLDVDPLGGAPSTRATPISNFFAKIPTDIGTDRWLSQDSNTFIGIDVAGAGNLAHTAGAEGYQNTAIGHQAAYSITTGNSNTAVGGDALYSLTTGAANVGLGYYALQGVNTGIYNVGIGYSAGRRITEGESNVAIGFGALTYCVDSDANTAVGMSALIDTTSGANTALGYRAAFTNTTGVGIAIGYEAMFLNETGTCNTAIGRHALHDNVTGGYNVGVGDYALEASTDINGKNTGLGYAALFQCTGSLNTAIGYEVGHNSDVTGCVYLGYQAGYANAVNSLLFIDNSNTATPLIWGDFANNRAGINVSAATGTFHIDQAVADAAIPVLVLDQADLSEGFVNYIGTSAASAVGPISSWTTGNTIQGFVRTEINGAAYWMPYYDAPTS